MIDWSQILTIANLIILVTTIIGGYFALKTTIARAENDVQSRIRQALHDENELLQSQVERQERDMRRLRAIFDLLITTLKKTHGIDIEIDGDVITFRSNNGVQVSKIDNDP